MLCSTFGCSASASLFMLLSAHGGHAGLPLGCMLWQCITEGAASKHNAWQVHLGVSHPWGWTGNLLLVPQSAGQLGGRQ